MTEKILERHGSVRNFILNLVLLGIVGAVLIRLVAFTFYTFMPADYFLRIERIEVEEPIYACQSHERTRIPAIVHRTVYPYLPENLQQVKAVEAIVIDELFKGDGRKIDDASFTPVYEWRPDNKQPIELAFKTTLLPGTYYIESTIIVDAPIVGKKDAVRVRSNTFTVYPCAPLTPLLKP